VPLYYFKLVDSIIVADHGVHELVDDAAARVEATKLARSLRDQSANIPVLGRLSAETGSIRTAARRKLPQRPRGGDDSEWRCEAEVVASLTAQLVVVGGRTSLMAVNDKQSIIETGA
jgi:hypothetical protein